jgi:hypothetical protein
LTRVWARRGTRPRAPRDHRYDWAYLFGAVCPARAVAAAVVLPHANADAMSIHLAEISRNVAPGAHAIVVMDGAGYHHRAAVTIPHNLSILTLPPYAPELNPVENVWQFLRHNFLAHQVFDGYDAIVDACCSAWNKLAQLPDQITSIATRDWAQTVTA